MKLRNVFFIAIISLHSLSAQSFRAHSAINEDIVLSKKFKHFKLLSIDVAGIKNALNSRSSTHQLQIVGEDFQWDLQLIEFSLLNPKYYRTEAGIDGIKKSPNNGRIKTYKVRSSVHRSGISNLTISDHFIYGSIDEAGIKTFIEPLSFIVKSAKDDEFILYNEEDVNPIEGVSCGVDNLKMQQKNIKANANQVRAGCIVVDVALSCDKTIFDSKGGINQAEAFMVGVLNDVQTVYDDEFTTAIELSLSTVFIPTTVSEDPWNGLLTIDAHLDKHETWANGGGYGGASYSVATSWSNKFKSGTIGIAWVGAVCTSLRYNVCSDFGGGAGLLRCLQAHEMGHNFNAIHDGAGSGFIMAPAVNNSVTWSSTSKSDISNYVKTLGCVGFCNGGVPPVAEFIGKPTIICENKSVQFEDQSSGGPTSLEWTFPGGTPSSSTSSKPLILYKKSGFYDVTLKVTNGFGTDQITSNNFIEVLPTLSNSFLAYVVDNNLTTVNNCQNADMYLWKFGDGASSMEDEPTHKYAKDGTYTVELCATNACGTTCKSSKVVVITPVTSNFSADIQKGCSSLTVKYKNLSSSNVNTYDWAFPGGTPSLSKDKEPIITYNDKGVYDVKLIVSNSKYSNTKLEKSFIRVESKPKSEFDSKAGIGNSIEFTNLTIDTILPSNFNYTWTFGDGKSSNEKNPIHQYALTGKYKVCLMVDNKCSEDSLCKQIELSSILSSSFSTKISKGCSPFQVDFQNNSTGALKYSWNFPGGIPSTSNEANPKIFYYSEGAYDVSLTAYNLKDSVINRKTSFLQVNTVPKPDFNLDINGLSAKFNNKSSHASSYSWKFSDGGISNEENPEHIYKAEGEYLVELIVSNECGESKISKKIAIYFIPKINFSSSTKQICVGDYLELKDLSSSDVKEWVWNIIGPESLVLNEQNPKLSFKKTGFYDVQLTVKSSNGQNSIKRAAYIQVRSAVLCTKRSGKKNKLIESGLLDEN